MVTCRYLEKKKRRNFKKVIRYQSRKVSQGDGWRFVVAAQTGRWSERADAL